MAEARAQADTVRLGDPRPPVTLKEACRMLGQGERSTRADIANGLLEKQYRGGSSHKYNLTYESVANLVAMRTSSSPSLEQAKHLGDRLPPVELRRLVRHLSRRLEAAGETPEAV